MKYLKDLIISRKDFQDWCHNLHWGKDGSMFLTTVPELTLIEPIYNTEVAGQCKNLFHVREYPLVIENKFEYETSQHNSLLDGQPESFVRGWIPSPDSISDNLFSVLTNNCNVIVYKHNKKVINLDEPDKPLSHRTYHCMNWCNNGQYLFVGNEESEVVVFERQKPNSDEVMFHYKTTIKLGANRLWITKLYSRDNQIIVTTDNNAIYHISFAKGFNNVKTNQVLNAGRFKVVDLKISENYAFITTYNKFYCINLNNNIQSEVTLPQSEGYSIVPLTPRKSEILLLSLSGNLTVQLNDFSNLVLMQDNIVTPPIEKKYKKWKTLSQEEFGKCMTNIRIFGSCISQDENSIAVLYNFERVAPKYSITSESQYRLMLLPLYDSWTISDRSAGLSLFQTYNIYDKKLPILKDCNNTEEAKNNTNIDFKEYIKNILSLKEMNKTMFQNFINPVPSCEFFRECIINYVNDHIDEIQNPLDKACALSLAASTNQTIKLNKETLHFKSEFISENFVFDNTQDSNIITSIEGHTWKRCLITLLPLLTVNVKVCPVSNERMIDIKKDDLNEYGWLTRTLLEVFHDQSVYTGATMK
ncbi:hypothetical protein TPHA_0P00400 [Tetrapisispora phaffii CBS 4417]|uniref:Transcription factor IIIC putative zinc-finger domain-containing protein n=1 Tax=Tetrapisispora phaffii (strain ATCC 24235 / CBS 4417 / NBRC 1672 / NRRL Y-8282 / UCD 70-5) TaxID=1071381 RepID=G8C220_TETPH|nr:hypothetical protein TPHA_0P00400 [Tetrapisispora phaffii CBS 4417]CCE66198.1 hypothetical protein TPHA_0P00400 [Tetrapisispora phaffii CBS 4417]